MQPSYQRRAILLAAAATPFVPCFASDSTAGSARFAALEAGFKGRLGVSAIDLGSGRQVGHRQDERFAMCSTFKVLAAAAVLRRSQREPKLLDKRIRYRKAELVAWSPITEKHLATGMTLKALCAAAMQYSDNTAANLIMKQLGGPAAVTAFARGLGDAVFRLDRWETELNEGTPGDPRDTTSAAAMTETLRKLAVGDALAAPQRAQLRAWLEGSTTGAARIRAGVPADWKVGDKTGSGDYGISNNIGLVWPPGREPVVMSIFFAGSEQKAESNNDVVASAARLVVELLASRPA